MLVPDTAGLKATDLGVQRRILRSRDALRIGAVMVSAIGWTA
jgi:hypothetical protein